jgi:hypothetical protein
MNRFYILQVAMDGKNRRYRSRRNHLIFSKNLEAVMKGTAELFLPMMMTLHTPLYAVINHVRALSS